MAKGASQAIKENVRKSRVAHPRPPRAVRQTIPEATALRGGTGPVRQGTDVRLPMPAPGGGS